MIMSKQNHFIKPETNEMIKSSITLERYKQAVKECLKLYYQTNNESNLEVYTVNDIKETIPSHSVYEYKIVIENYNETNVDVTLGVASSIMQGEVKAPGIVIEKREI